jgi:tetratricopeptide (TPR) repeat protein
MIRSSRSRTLRAVSLISALAVTLLAAAPALAQDWAGRGRLQGVLKDEEGKPVEGARLTFRKGAPPVDVAAPGPAPVVSNAKGRWSIGGLAQGPWAVLIEKDGFLQSEGQLNADQFSTAPSVTITMKKPTQEMLDAAAAQTAAGQAREALDRGNGFLTAGKWAEARGEFEAALALVDAEYQPMILRAIAQTLAQEKSYPEALAKLEQAQAMKPEAETLMLTAQVQHSAGQSAAAIDTLKKALELKPDDAAVTQLLAELLMDAGRENEAKEYIARLPAGAKLDPVSLLNSGIRLYNANKYTEAVKVFDQVANENPEMPESYYYRGLAYLPLGKMAEAKADLEKFVQMAPDHKQAADAKEILKSM